ncbi:class I SAM-dependent methyltransferase [Candidatus Uabimicrobium amorphum]|uniref:SAM-dependent methyltransferase n=1 Tax=Uabimicrobium amorphum TaxID=2596890 RepID=A0A5S9IML7_UABAM|nr:class I SAM-dependent methyltransferase [Candidatus Uabimicrobium amorphum]BBM84688.1 SAM-dependent methyltransferase [Candidatus Uabimicrobium amorphum]
METPQESPKLFYDNLAEHYHLIANNWQQAVVRQREQLQTFFDAISLPKNMLLLDCTCGVGTQAIGLAQMGHDVHACDLSPQSIAKARKNAQQFAIDISFFVSDMRHLRKNTDRHYDMVVAFDNAIPHLLIERDVLCAFRNIYECLRPSGTFIFSIRDYDAILENRPQSTLPRNIDDEFGQRITFQTWEWQPQTNIYNFQLFILQKQETHWETKCFPSTYRAYRRGELSDLLEKIGFRNIRWYMPEESGYYQPIVVAHKFDRHNSC